MEVRRSSSLPKLLLCRILHAALSWSCFTFKVHILERLLLLTGSTTGCVAWKLMLCSSFWPVESKWIKELGESLSHPSFVYLRRFFLLTFSFENRMGVSRVGFDVASSVRRVWFSLLICESDFSVCDGTMPSGKLPLITISILDTVSSCFLTWGFMVMLFAWG